MVTEEKFSEDFEKKIAQIDFRIVFLKNKHTDYDEFVTECKMFFKIDKEDTFKRLFWESPSIEDRTIKKCRVLFDDNDLYYDQMVMIMKEPMDKEKFLKKYCVKK